MQLGRTAARRAVGDRAVLHWAVLHWAVAHMEAAVRMSTAVHTVGVVRMEAAVRTVGVGPRRQGCPDRPRPPEGTFQPVHPVLQRGAGAAGWVPTKGRPNPATLPLPREASENRRQEKLPVVDSRRAPDSLWMSRSTFLPFPERSRAALRVADHTHALRRYILGRCRDSRVWMTGEH